MEIKKLIIKTLPGFSHSVMILLVVIIAAYVTGCASSRSGEVYSRDQARQVQIVENGTVESVKEVTIEGTKTPIGIAAGGVAGGVLGSTIGSGSGKTVAVVLGALAGAAAGTLVEEGITRKPALEIIVKKDNGQTLVVVQEADIMIAAGDRVRIITAADGTTRVSK
ncbi:MAG: glycine zipper 2TM domain-containing protein [Desulfobacula sp.]|uniref:glycine zipper 2TM domain-containing protein n=1 Tax=Desulfobacula sp. TaxID=2593537 RepID=UPI0025C70FD0|nr:glycine zipper 2TM domain-containing protein [Desulfobacula sp.]MCD4719651.1 glycine zipper 2TM domain-containing protein [Desulfobacula sp.]